MGAITMITITTTIGVCLVLIIAYYSVKSTLNNRVKYATYKHGIMTLTYADNSTAQYKGECTVWNRLPYMERAGTSTESELCDIWKYIEHNGNPYPTAHKSTSK